MRTTLNIDEKLLEEVVCETGEKDKGKAVNAALTEFMRLRNLDKLRSLRGKLDLRSRDEWHERDLELELEHRKNK